MLIQKPPVQIAENLLMLGTTEYPLYLVDGENEATVFEAGIAAMGPVVREQVEQLGIDVDRVKQLVIPHAHPDHAMAAPELRKIFPGLEVLASEPAANTLSIEKAIGFFAKINAALSESCIREGVIGQQHHPGPFEEKTIAVDRTVADGDTIAVDGFSFRVVQAFGHSDCSLAFHEPDKGILIISDAVPYYLVRHNYCWPCYFAGYQAFLDTMGQLAELGAEVVCMGHHGAVTGAEDVRTFFAEMIAATEQYHRRIVDEAKAGKSVREIAEGLGAEIQAKSPLLPLDFFQKNCALLVKQSLKHEGMGEEK